jgi:hypothetical protein
MKNTSPVFRVWNVKGGLLEILLTSYKKLEDVSGYSVKFEGNPFHTSPGGYSERPDGGCTKTGWVVAITPTLSCSSYTGGVAFTYHNIICFTV